MTHPWKRSQMEKGPDLCRAQKELFYDVVFDVRLPGWTFFIFTVLVYPMRCQTNTPVKVEPPARIGGVLRVN